MNKGYQSLPEYVQRKIDPEMAKKYMGGGSVMQRPMFRQAGGPMMAPPPMAPPPMAPEPSMDMASQQLQQMEQQTSGIGSAVAQQTLSNIDAADDPKSMIDALRGNERPLESRYAELAGFVGEADAQQTPESVLAMVQPTIMMTEEGALDSGVGELMQGLASQIDMETPSGEATPMGQGVGELMAMGAGNTPPVNFNQGGAVRHYAPGGAVTERATTMLPEFQSLYASVLGDPAAREAELEEQKKLTKAQMLFDIAQTALAAGAPTAQPMSAAERLMSAAQGTQLFNKIGDRAAGQLQAKQALEKEKRQMDLAALQSSVAAAQSQKEASDAMDRTLAGVTPAKPIKLGVNEVLFSADGTELARGTERQETITLGEGQIVFGADGTEIAKGPEKKKSYTLGPGQTLFSADGTELANVPDTYQLPEGSVVKDAEGNIIVEGNKKQKTHLLGPNQKLVDGSGAILAKGKMTKETVTLGPGQEVVDIETNETIAKGPPKFESVTFYKTSEGTLLSKAVNVGTDEGLKAATLLMKQGFIPEDLEARAFIEQQMRPDQMQVIESPNAEGGIDLEIVNLTKGTKKSLGASDNIPDFIVADGRLVQTRGTTSGKPEIVLDKQGLDSMFGGGDLGKAATYVSNENLLKYIQVLWVLLTMKRQKLM